MVSQFLQFAFCRFFLAVFFFEGGTQVECRRIIKSSTGKKLDVVKRGEASVQEK